MYRDRAANLRSRARILQGIRAFFVSRGYLEVETPHRIPSPAQWRDTDRSPVATAGRAASHTRAPACEASYPGGSAPTTISEIFRR